MGGGADIEHGVDEVKCDKGEKSFDNQEDDKASVGSGSGIR